MGSHPETLSFKCTTLYCLTSLLNDANPGVGRNHRTGFAFSHPAAFPEIPFVSPGNVKPGKRNKNEPATRMSLALTHATPPGLREVSLLDLLGNYHLITLYFG